MCPSPETRSPFFSPFTSEPISTMRPQYSCPTAIGTGMVFCAQASQLKMCMSVPQIAVFAISMSTSFGPTLGSAISSSQMPGFACCLTSAFMRFSLLGVRAGGSTAAPLSCGALSG